jgi:hypothetical protein
MCTAGHSLLFIIVEWSPLFIGALFGVLASLVAAVTYVFVADRIKGYRLKKRFSKLRGRYVQCNLQGEPFEGRFTDITKVQRNLLTVEGDDATPDKWHSTILMDERFPGFGFGQYQYNNRSDCGRHEVQVKDDGKVIFVQVQNTSSGQNPTFACLWKKVEKG